MKLHPDDTAALDALRWSQGACGICSKSRSVAGAGEGPACRSCLEYRLFLDRDSGMALRSLAQAAGGAR
ncbi:hypothetical protein [Streptacidiphilus sp. EB129]|uniref:hypothetical protein n=1 Tax=Streptacidiphilus sp. EB129 TaxID=3156262 RepID=UPI003516C2A7